MLRLYSPASPHLPVTFPRLALEASVNDLNSSLYEKSVVLWMIFGAIHCYSVESRGMEISKYDHLYTSNDPHILIPSLDEQNVT